MSGNHEPGTTPDETAGGRQPAGCVIHASAVLVGAVAVVIRGASGAGKSSLVLDLIATLAAEGRFARLIGDDRVTVEASNGRLIVRVLPITAGLIERRGQGIARLPFEPAGIVGVVVDLITGEPDRLPDRTTETTDLCGISVRRIELAGFGAPRTRVLLAALDEPYIDNDALPE